MIYIDTQEVPSEIVDLLHGMNIKFKVGRLKFGDFIITGKNGQVIIERKEAKDYVGSLISGHLNDQLIRMTKRFKRTILLVEGSISAAIAEVNVPRKTYFSSLAGTAIKTVDEGEMGAVSIIPVDSNWDTAMLLERTQLKLDDPEGLIRTPYIGAPQVTGKDPQVAALCAIDLVGEVTARLILEKFSTIIMVARATIPELMEVEKVGKAIATNVYEFFRKPYEVKQK